MKMAVEIESHETLRPHESYPTMPRSQTEEQTSNRQMLRNQSIDIVYYHHLDIIIEFAD